MRNRLNDAVAPERQRTIIFGAFAVIAVLLTAIGLYGLLSYTVTQSMHELGVRVALGASRPQLLRFVIFKGVSPVLTGVILGTGGGLVLTRMLGRFLYGITATDPATFMTAAFAMIVVAAVACVVASRRAIAADPIVALRAE
jgi:putative ABC transport system permease protein